MAMTNEASMKMHRCVCGEVYDLLKHKKCPECGAAKDSGSPAAAPEQQSTQSDSTLPESAQERDWKKICIGIGVALVLYLMLRGGSSNSSSTNKSIHGDETPVANLDMSDSPLGKLGAQAYSGVDYSVTDGVVDPKLVGTWIQTVKTMNGDESWQIEIDSDGSYAFKTSGTMVSVQHNGEFSAENGKWKLSSSNTGWKDGGSYSVPRPDLFVMMGALGTGQWRKAE